MKPAGLKITKPRNSTDHRSGLSLSVARWNSYQVWWAPDTFGLIRKKEETLALNREENAPQEHGKTVVFKPADLRGFRNDADTAPSAPSAPSAPPASLASPARRGPDSGSLFGARHVGSPPRPGLGRPTLPHFGPPLPQSEFQPGQQPGQQSGPQLVPAPSSKSAPCAAGRGLAFFHGRSAMRFNLSIQAIGLIETIGIRKIPGRSESRCC